MSPRPIPETGTTKDPATVRAEAAAQAVKALAAPRRADAWTEYAACATVDPELFYPEPGQRGMALAAVRVCMGCPVRAACEARALGEDGEEPERDGVWGGLTASERQRILRHRRRYAA